MGESKASARALPSLQSPFVAIEPVSGKGRGLIALTTIPRGTVILDDDPVIDLPLTVSLIPSETRLALLWWLVEQKICDESFQEINRLSHLDHPNPSHQQFVDAAYSAYEFLESESIDFIALSPEQWSVVRQLIQQKEDILQNIQKKLSQIRVNVFAVHSLTSNSISEEHTISQLSQEKSALGLYPAACLLNHSCAPNSVLHFSANHLTVRAEEDIFAGSEICISYGPHYLKHNREMRQQQLLQAYHFHCQCSKCANPRSGNPHGWACPRCQQLLDLDNDNLSCLSCHRKMNYNSFQERQDRAEKCVILGDMCSDNHNFAGALQQFTTSLTIYKGILVPNEHRLGRVYDRLAELYATGQDFSMSASYCQKSVEIVESLYGPTSPETANELVKLTELYFNARDARNCMINLEKACRALSICYGQTNDDYRRLMTMKQFLKSKMKK